MRGGQYQKAFQHKIEEESIQKKFLAQPMPLCQPFQPERSKKKLTAVKPFISHTDTRVEQRKHFDDEKDRRQKDLEREEQHHQTLLAVFCIN